MESPDSAKTSDAGTDSDADSDWNAAFPNSGDAPSAANREAAAAPAKAAKPDTSDTPAPKDDGRAEASDEDAQLEGEAQEEVEDDEATDEADPDDPLANLELPEGSTLDEAALASARDFARDHGLSLEQAEALLARDAERVTSADAQWDATVETWQTTLADDLGDKWDEADQYATKALRKFAGPEFFEVLKDSGFNVYPPLFEMFRKIGESMSEPKGLVRGNSTSDRSLSPDEEWETAFPNSGPPPSRLAHNR